MWPFVNTGGGGISMPSSATSGNGPYGATTGLQVGNLTFGARSPSQDWLPWAMLGVALVVAVVVLRRK